MNHYVYETTNLINGKKYIGKRSCNCPIEDDEYIGSGKAFKCAVKKYGKENFKKEILQICENEEMAYEWEKVYIEQVKAYENPVYYNITKGGEGTLGLLHSEQAKLKISSASKTLWSNSNHRKYMKMVLKKRHSNPNYKKKLRENWIGEKNPNFYGLSAEVKLKLSNKRKKLWENDEYRKKVLKSREGTQSGSKHPMYGRRGSKNPNSIKIICLNNMKVYNALSDVYRDTGIDTGSLCKCCKGKVKSAGKINGEPAKWMYYEDYLKNNNL